jgi:carbamoyl-phosphate synthase large subunit
MLNNSFPNNRSALSAQCSALSSALPLRVFVSGGAGVIGTALVEQLLSLGATVFVGDLKPCPPSWRNKVQYRMGDLVTIDKKELIEFSPEIFFHLAATFERSTESYPFYQENFHHNVQLSHHLMACLQECPALQKVVFASSYLIYDPSLYTFSDAQQFPVTLREDSAIYPRNICGAAKLFHEQELRFFETFFSPRVQLTSARIFRVYGYGSRDIISRWIREALRGKTISVYSPEGLFDYIFAEDVATGLLKLSQCAVSGIFNLGSGHARRISDVLNILKGQFPDLKIEEVKIPSGENSLIEASQADMQRFEEHIHWKPTQDLETAIPKLVQFEKQQLSAYITQTRPQAILITSVSKKVPLLNAVRTASKKIGCYEQILGSDANEKCIAKYLVDKFWNCPALPELSRELLTNYCHKNNIKAIIPTRDGELLFFSEHRAWLAQKGIFVMVSTPEAIQFCLDKKLFADTLLNQQLPAIPTSFSIEEFDTQYYVVKECFGAGSAGVGVKLSKQEAKAKALDLKNPIFQPYIDGTEYSIDLYRDLSGKVKGTVARQRNLIVNGESQITTTVRKPELEDLCKLVSSSFNLYGHATFQALECSKGQFYLIECNPRFGGASTASIAAGLDTFYWFLLECEGESLDHYPFNRIKNEIRQVRHAIDTIQQL